MSIAFIAAALLAQSVPAAVALPVAGQPQQQGAAPAQAANAAPAWPREVSRRVLFWNTCLELTIEATPGATPEAAAKRAIDSCQWVRPLINKVAESWINGGQLTAAQQTEMRRRLASIDQGLEGRIVEQIRASRTRPSATSGR